MKHYIIDCCDGNRMIELADEDKEFILKECYTYQNELVDSFNEWIEHVDETYFLCDLF